MKRCLEILTYKEINGLNLIKALKDNDSNIILFNYVNCSFYTEFDRFNW